MKFITAVAAAIILSGCGPSPSSNNSGASGSVAAARPARPAEKPDQPLLENTGENTYRVAALGITVDAPAGWYVADSELMGKLMDEGVEISGANLNAGEKAAVDSAMARTVTLFSFLEVPPGSPREYIPAAMGIAEDISMLPGVTRGKDYFFHARKTMEMSAIPIVTSDVFAERMIDGRSFDRMDAQVTAPGGLDILQRYYAARRGNNMIIFVQSYRTDEELAQLDAVLDGIKLDW